MKESEIFQAVKDVDFFISCPHRELTDDYIEGIRDCQEAILRGLYLYAKYHQWKGGNE